LKNADPFHSARRKGWIFTALVVIPFLQLQATPSLPAQISVGLADRQESALVESEAPFSITEFSRTDVLFKTSRIRLVPSKRGLETDGTHFPGDIAIIPEPGRVLKYLGKTYKGSLEIKKTSSGGILVINHVPLEDYLTGVLPFEVPPEWKPETLKAQAVVCRTFAVSSLKRHDAEGYDVCALTHCQVYRGASGEDARTSRAVAETKGVIITYLGKPIEAYFHDDCGGMTESAEDVWTGGGHLPYLKRVRCPSTVTWKASLTAADICQAVPSPKMEPSDIKNLKISSRTPSGRARMITISTRHHGKITIPANTLRLRLGADIIKSTFWRRIEHRKTGWVIWGTGWGHGVGLCQWGAERLGERGWNYEKILKRYFKGITIERGI
jgi:stage II sporulation protein D